MSIEEGIEAMDQLLVENERHSERLKVLRERLEQLEARVEAL